jgi:hypothetical protein
MVKDAEDKAAWARSFWWVSRKTYNRRDSPRSMDIKKISGTVGVVCLPFLGAALEKVQLAIRGGK